MDQGTVINLAQNALLTLLMVASPILGLSLLVGLAISVFQAATQIHEQTLTFVPKIIAVIISVAVFGTWMLRKLIEFTESLYGSINTLIN